MYMQACRSRTDGKDLTYDHGTDVIVESNTSTWTWNIERTKDVGEGRCYYVSQLSEETIQTLDRCSGEPRPSKENTLPSNNCLDEQVFSRDSLFTSNNGDETYTTYNIRDDATGDAQESLKCRGRTCDVEQTKGEEGFTDSSHLKADTALTLERRHGQPQLSTESVLSSDNCPDVQEFSSEMLLTSYHDDETNITPYKRDSASDDKQEGIIRDIKAKIKGIFGYDDTTCAVRIPSPNHFLLMYATASGKLVLLRLFFRIYIVLILFQS